MFGTMREREEFSSLPPIPSTEAPLSRALGLEALHNVCKEIYPDQSNPLTVTAIIKYWLGGPDPLDYISMYENPGCPELGVPPHWHYISLGLSDLHGDGRLHPKSSPGQPSGFGFELTFRLVRESGETSPPTWPANVMQQLAKYVFNSGNMLLPGDHVSWHSPLGKENGRITQILMGKDAQFLDSISTPHGEVSFVQIIGVTSEELQAAQHWNGLGVINLLKTTQDCGPWLVTNINRSHSAMEQDPTVAEKIQTGIEREGSNLSGVSAKCWWVQMTNNISPEKYREKTKDVSDDEEDDVEKEENDDSIENCPPRTSIKSDKLSSDRTDPSILNDNFTAKPLTGLHLTFNLEAGSLLPLAIKGRIMHGRHFTFKSVLSHSAITVVASSVTGTLVSSEKPYVVQGPWLQVLIPDALAVKMAEEFQVFSLPNIQLPRTFSWPEYNLAITIVTD
ncbi:suppressor of fused homolog [Chelonus insularis]|uniref:suppressor of fused homolog n=1 Tax=Chelonus insularis TaxID=460826 RepID=UPI0015882CEB|nr:suppressor of fused homolog [Chelonus insularis]XP_034948203.1 suppressor of fused homolog [Chelonus insularis]XP_034948204.1 suppressor of fused homolog [Chelonus insularis]